VSDPLAELAVLTGEAWLVGGALRDRLLSRESTDYDVALAGDPAPIAKALARRAGGHPFLLSEAFGGWRVLARDRSWQLDLLPVVGGSIESDLGNRDFTINAIAQPIGGGGCIDPFGGLEDLAARRLRSVSERAFEQDPLRTLRLARFGCELGFGADPATVALAARSAGRLRDVAPERIFLELRLIVRAERALDGLALMDTLGVTEVVLPELAALRGIEQSRYHHLDVYDHTRAVLAETIELERDPEPVFGGDAGALAGVLCEPLANELTRAEALRFGALLHDIAKPLTRGVTAEGRVTFMGHDALGARMALELLARLRASERLGEYVAAVTRHHLRLGFLVHHMPLDRRAVYRYLKTCSPVQVDVTVLSVADRLATRGARSDAAIAKHLELARQLLPEALAWRRQPPRPPVRGDELARAAGVEAGPEIGRVLGELEEASYAGEIHGRDQALDRGTQLLRR
jgi:poly(A) polymerase